MGSLLRNQSYGGRIVWFIFAVLHYIYPHKIYIISCLAGREFRMGEEFGSGEG